MNRIRRQIIVHGSVQAVGFRASTSHQAERTGVAGFVRNLDDGSVEIEAEGAQPAVDALIDWARSGPPSAEVTDVTVSERDPIGDNRFRVE